MDWKDNLHIVSAVNSEIDGHSANFPAHVMANGNFLCFLHSMKADDYVGDCTIKIQQLVILALVRFSKEFMARFPTTSSCGGSIYPIH